MIFEKAETAFVGENETGSQWRNLPSFFLNGPRFLTLLEVALGWDGGERTFGWVNFLRRLLGDELKRFSPHITRIELYLADKNGPKKGVNDKRCALEVRLAGHKPLAVSDLADTYDLAVKGAIGKVKAVLDSTLGKG